MTAPSSSPSLGHIGRYELLDRLGAGGMGEVFLARTTGAAGFEKQVVIKKILPHLAGNEAFVRRFVAEGKLVVRLRHASIAQVLDMGEDAGAIYLAMEYVDGRDLRELLRLSRGTAAEAAPELKVAILLNVLEALDHAHHCTGDDGEPLAIIHRDVSPSNVMVSRTGEVKLLDFGIARASDRLGLSVSGSVQGKFGYMSPQQAAGGELDARSDQFSVGVMGWELFAGARPFDGQTDLETLDRIRQHDPGSLTDAAPDAPAEVVEAVGRMLTKDPEARYGSAAEAADALRGYLYRVGAMVGARQLGEWVERVLELLPPEARGRPGLALSLDEALRLSLDPGDQSPAGPTATATAAAVSEPGTPAVALAVPDASPPLEPVAPALVPVRVTQTDTAAPEPPRSTAGRLIALLVVMNVLLLGAVGLLVWQVSGDDEQAPEPEHVTAPIVSRPSSPPPGPPVDAVPVPEAAPSPAPVAAEETPAPTPAPTPLTAGQVVGAALGSVAVPPPLPAVPSVLTVTVRATPTTAKITIPGHGAGPSPRRLKLSRGARRTGSAEAPGFQSRDFSFHAERDNQVVRVTLVAEETGRVTFRYFPASASVLIDGRAVAPRAGSNVVDRELPAGSHKLTLVAPDGAKAHRSFKVRPGKTENLKTIKVLAAAPPSP